MAGTVAWSLSVCLPFCLCRLSHTQGHSHPTCRQGDQSSPRLSSGFCLKKQAGLHGGLGGGEGTSLSCSFSGGRLDSREIPGSPLPPSSPPSPTAPEVQAGLILTHLRALSTGQPPRSHQCPPPRPEVSFWGGTCEVWPGKEDLAGNSAMEPQRQEASFWRRDPDPGEDVAIQALRDSHFPPRSGLQPQDEARQPLGVMVGVPWTPLATSLGHTWKQPSKRAEASRQRRGHKTLGK